MKVQWQPWTRSAFERARAEDTLVFLSIHAKWCSWCRLMDETSYADPEVVERLSGYVPVRIDADARPDLTERYHMGGLPSTIFLTADAEILWGATFLPPEQLRLLLRRFRSGFQQFRDAILEEVARREEKIRLIESSTVTGRIEPTEEIVRKTILGIQMAFDPVHGGFGREPKFPMPQSIELLFQALRWTGGIDFEVILRKTLDAMATRSLFDSVDGGFHRYCATEGWGAPRTEKLLVENARLARCYLRGWQAFGDPRYRETAERTLDWAMRTLWSPESSRFWNGQVADAEYFGADASKRRTLQAPAVDRTVVTSSNAAMVSTLAQSWAVLGIETHLDTARACLDAIRRTARRPDGGTAHLPEDPASEVGLLRDPIAVATASLDLFEAAGDPRDLEEARRLCEGIIRTHGGPSGLVDRIASPDDVGKRAAPKKDLAENAAAADLFLRLAAHTEDAAWRERAASLLSSFPDYIGQYGPGTAGYALAVARLLRAPVEIWLVEPPDEVRRAAVASAGPGRTIRIADRAGAASLGLALGPGAYVCVGARRLPPARTAVELEERLVAAD